VIFGNVDQSQRTIHGDELTPGAVKLGDVGLVQGNVGSDGVAPMRFCSHCGQSLAGLPISRFCPSCGSALQTAE
jgi:hypothetical protein